MSPNLFGEKPKIDLVRVGEIKTWARGAFALDDDAMVMVSEVRCTEPGCPPLETVIATLAGPGQTKTVKIHKAIAEMTRDDVVAAAK